MRGAIDWTVIGGLPECPLVRQMAFVIRLERGDPGPIPSPYSLNVSGEKIGMNLRAGAFELQSSPAGVLARHSECETGRPKKCRE
jgi:hypothetical protein